MSGKPETEQMPGDWSIKCSELQKLCILKALRLDRVLFAAARFVSANIGPEYVDPPSFDLKAVYETSNCRTPLIFVLSPGVDPTAGILQLASQLNQKVENCALGQGQVTTSHYDLFQKVNRNVLNFDLPGTHGSSHDRRRSPEGAMGFPCQLPPHALLDAHLGEDDRGPH